MPRLIKCLLIPCLLVFPLSLHAAVIQGTLLSNSPPQPTYGLVMAINMADDSYTYTFTEPGGAYSLSLTDGEDWVLVAIASTGTQMQGYDLHEYLVVTHVAYDVSSTQTVNFTTQPAYQIVLVGRRDKAVVEDSDYGSVFVTDLDGNTRPIVPLSVENQTLDVVVPSFNLPLGEDVIVHLQWELPHAGRIMVRLDNEGAGFSGAAQGAVILDVNEQVAKTAIAQLEQDIAAAEVDTADADDALDAAQEAFDDADFDEAAGLAIVAQEELALDHARANISRYRTGALTVNVLDADGVPVPGAQVSVSQQDRDFRFGFFDGYIELGETLAQQVLDDGFNFFTAGVYWIESEPTDDQYDWDLLDHDVGIVEMSQLGFTVKGHPLIWLYPFAMPDYLQAMNEQELDAEFEEHVTAIVDRYSDRVRTWDVINEAHGWAASGGFTRARVTEITRNVIDQVHALDPGATTIVNCAFDWYGQSSAFEPMLHNGDVFGLSVPAYFEDLQTAGAMPDVLGQQMYNGGCSTLFYQLGLGDVMVSTTHDLAEMARMFSRLGEFGLPIHVTEHSVPSAMIPLCDDREGYWRAPWSEAQQAAYVEAFYTLAFGQEYVQAITWWDLLDADSFIDIGGLRGDGDQPKQAYMRLVDMMAQWWTDAVRTCGDDGATTLNVYGGTHKVSVQFDEHQADTVVYVAEQTDKQIDVVLSDYHSPGDDDDNDDTVDDDDDDNDDGCGC